MQRRTLLRLGLGASVLLGVTGWGAARWQPGWQGNSLSGPAQALWRAVARSVLAGVLPSEASAQGRALDAWLLRLQVAIANLPPSTRVELSELTALLGLPPARLAIAGLRRDWADASVEDVTAALQRMRLSRLSVPQQVYHALRDLCNAAWFSDNTTWSFIGYPGPQPL